MHADGLEGDKKLVALKQRAIAEREPLAADTAARAQAANDRLAGAEKGQDVAIPAPMTHKAFLKAAGMTEAQSAALRARRRDRRRQG